MSVVNTAAHCKGLPLLVYVLTGDHSLDRAVCEGVPTGAFHPKHGYNVARIGLLDILQLCCMHADQASCDAAETPLGMFLHPT